MAKRNSYVQRSVRTRVLVSDGLFQVSQVLVLTILLNVEVVNIRTDVDGRHLGDQVVSGPADKLLCLGRVGETILLHHALQCNCHIHGWGDSDTIVYKDAIFSVQSESITNPKSGGVWVAGLGGHSSASSYWMAPAMLPPWQPAKGDAFLVTVNSGTWGTSLDGVNDGAVDVVQQSLDNLESHPLIFLSYSFADLAITASSHNLFMRSQS